ncbi:MAG TPA: hypothetical protein VHY08_22585 [Bacillota bacterium]|nr:hypothetical protein [Bacillota bacterium]
MSRKLTFSITLFSILFLLLACLPTSAAAEELSSSGEYAVGYLFSRPASGFTVKLPINDQYYLQPIFSFSLAENEDSARKNLAVGLRAVSNLPARQEFRPYAGLSWGHSEGFYDDSNSSPITTGGTGFDVFIGVEYEKYMIHPSLEVGLGSYARTDGDYLVGTTFSFSVLYYF